MFVYLFFFDLSIRGNANVTVGMTADGNYRFEGVEDKIGCIQWMDNGEELEFSQNGDELLVKATRYPSGMSTCVRVAKANI